jgi:hypothetical protein
MAARGSWEKEMCTTKFRMTPTKSLASATALLVALAAFNPAFATCSHLTQITSNSGITLEFSEVKSSSSPPFFKSQWTGSRVIASGATGSIPWTSDLNCTDASGVENHWDVKFIRANGNVHYCGYLAPSQAVKVNTPDLCFPN